MTPTQVKIWFQNHRYKLKRAEKEKGGKLSGDERSGSDVEGTGSGNASGDLCMENGGQEGQNQNEFGLTDPNCPIIVNENAADIQNMPNGQMDIGGNNEPLIINESGINEPSVANVDNNWVNNGSNTGISNLSSGVSTGVSEMTPITSMSSIVQNNSYTDNLVPQNFDQNAAVGLNTLNSLNSTNPMNSRGLSQPLFNYNSSFGNGLTSTNLPSNNISGSLNSNWNSYIHNPPLYQPSDNLNFNFNMANTATKC